MLFAAAHWFDQQRLGFDDQLFPNLVSTPALPAFELTRSRQRRVGGGFKRAVNIADVLLQGHAQFSGNLGCGFAVAFADFML